MPIYAYACSHCGFEKDVLQKMSAPVLTQCPECEQETFTKQLTAAGFQLKGSGWYETDFKGSKKNDAQKSGAEKTATSTSTGTETAGKSTTTERASSNTTDSSSSATSAGASTDAAA